MSTPAELFDFYFRYKWGPAEFEDFQAGMVDTVRASAGALVNGAVLSGADISPSGSSMVLVVSPYVANGPDGYTHISETTKNVTIAAADATLPRIDMIVSRAVETTTQSITRPTSPFDTVPFRRRQDCELVVLSNSPNATPLDPNPLTNDVVLARVYVPAASVAVAQNQIDSGPRDIPGTNNQLLQNSVNADTRLQPYSVSSSSLGIRPSQSRKFGTTRGLVYLSSVLASKFPRDGSGNFNDADTFLNFTTGAITGGDASSGDFTPVIPSSLNSIVAIVTMSIDDRIHVSYGTQGTLSQCMAAIENQTFSGAGCLPNVTPGDYSIAIVVITSANGTAPSNMRVIDARGTFFTGTYEQSITRVVRPLSLIATREFYGKSATAANNWNAVGYAQPVNDTGGVLVALSVTGTGNRGMRSLDGGETWSSSTVPEDNSWQGIAYSPSLGILVAVASTGTNKGMSSTDNGATWTARAISATAMWDVCWAEGLGKFFAVGSNVVYSSTNGTSWTLASSPSSVWDKITWSERRKVLVMVSSSGAKAYSSDGSSWTVVSTGNNARGIAYSPKLDRFVAASISDFVQYSDDGGATWNDGPTIVEGHDVQWSESLEIFVMTSPSIIQISADGLYWQNVKVESGGSWMSLVFMPDRARFCTVSSGGPTNRVAVSL